MSPPLVAEPLSYTEDELATVFPRQRSVHSGPVETRVFEAGDGPAVLLVHGNPDTHTVWSGVVARLAEGHRCLAPDLPGFGRSRAPRDYDCSLEAQAEWVRGLLDGLGLDRVHLVVHDIGGSHGLAFASLHPRRVRTLTIFNTNFFPDYRWHFWARVWRTPVLGGLVLATTTRRPFVREILRGSPGVPRAYAEHEYAHYTRATRHRVRRWYRAMDPSVLTGWDTRFLEATAGTPKQVLWGDLDPFIPPTTAERYGGEVHRFPDCGHHLMVERPEPIATAIASLIARHSA